MTTPATTRAVVLGGSLTGLLAARVLADHSSEVLVVARGASVGDVSSRAAWWFPHGRLAHSPSGMDAVAASRPLIEGEVRRRVTALPNVSVRGRTDVAGVTATADGTRVTGARLVDRAPGAVSTVVPADLVVDATGRGSRTPSWLAGLGYPAPPEDRIERGVSYVSRTFPVRPRRPRRPG